eukprot:gene2402-8711_t
MASLAAKSSRCVIGKKATPARAAVMPIRAPRASFVRCRAEAEEAPAPAPISIEKSGPNMTAVKEINEIMAALPHRYPFLLVDRVVEWEAEKYAVGYKCITINDNFFPGHFPERPIMPGVLQVEAMAQLAGLCMLDPEDKEGKGLFFFGGIEKCRFRKPVVPGDVLMMRTDVIKNNKRFGVVKIAAKGYVGTDLVVEAELTLAMAPKTAAPKAPEA